MICDHCFKEIPEGDEALASNGKDVHEGCHDRYEAELARDRDDAKRDWNDSWRGDL